MHDAVVGLGSNLGSSAALLEAAIALLDDTPGLTVRERSQLYLTPPLGPSQPDFHNAAVRVGWVGTAHGLLDVLLHVEARLGRERRERWGPRTVDLDLLWWSGPAVDSARLRVPHPELYRRAFALAPLLDVVPALRARWDAALRALGGRPPTLAWPGATAFPAQVAGPFVNEAHALATAAQRCLEALPAGEGPLCVLPWHATPGGVPEQRTVWEPIARMNAPLRLGFVPRLAAVTDAQGPLWRGLWLARRLPAPGPLPALPHWVLKRERPGGAVWLTLSSKSG